MTYSELLKLPTYSERLQALQLHSSLFTETFAVQRWLNQIFYTSYEWKHCRDNIIIRDYGCDLAIQGLDIPSRIIIHHIEPITIEDIEKRSSKLLDPENLICTCYDTHYQIHYGVRNPDNEWRERTPNDTCPWKNF